MSWIRRRGKRPEPDGGRLPALEFLALVRDALEELAPGCTEGAGLKGDSLLSPRGWAVGVAAGDPGAAGEAHQYDLIAFPDVGIQPEVPCFVDRAVVVTTPRDAAVLWARSAGACLLALTDTAYAGLVDDLTPDDPYGVPGWRSLGAGALAYGVSEEENHRLQEALLEADVLGRITPVFAADLASPWFNAVRVFHGGAPGAVRSEVRVNGERHEAASAALAELGLPEPTVFTAVRSFTLLLPPDPEEDHDPEHGHRDGHGHGVGTCGAGRGGCCGGGCACGGALDPRQPGFAHSLPHLIAELSPAEREERITHDSGAVMVARGLGNFLKVRLPVRLDDGRTLVHVVWVYVRAEVIEDYTRRVHDGTLEGHRFEGLFCNAVEPWGEELLKAPVLLGGQKYNADGSLRMTEVLDSEHPLMSRVLKETWPAADLLRAAAGA
ncbi:DUF6348 family protein [Streptomyces sp. NPDC097619]|uniref:DUF6348 family protein n=1 Tax=Streptomyces sp. NPDC097619 TaxID=3157228 RepID=UPI00332C5BC4